ETWTRRRTATADTTTVPAVARPHPASRQGDGGPQQVLRTSRAVLQCHRAAVLQCGPGERRHRGTVALQHGCTAALQHRSTAALLPPDLPEYALVLAEHDVPAIVLPDVIPAVLPHRRAQFVVRQQQLQRLDELVAVRVEEAGVAAEAVIDQHLAAGV